MDDTIYRQAALNTVQKMYERCDMGDMRDYHDLLMEAFEVLPSAQRWIPCSERIPEARGFYLTTTKDKVVYCDYWNEDNFNRTEMVVAWMPLPAPYMGEVKHERID